MTKAFQLVLIDGADSVYGAVSAALHRGVRSFHLRVPTDPAELDAALAAGIGCVLCHLRPGAAFGEGRDEPGGLAVLRRILALPAPPPVVILCAPEDEVPHARQAMHLGAADYALPDAWPFLPQVVQAASVGQPHQDEYRLALAVLRGSSQGVCVTNPAGDILLVNDAFTLLTGYPLAEVRGKNPRVLQSGVHDAAFYVAMWQALLTRGHWQGEITNRRKDGEIYSEWLHISTVYDENGAPQYYVGQFGFVAEQHQLIERISHLTQFDPLTGLPNRALFMERLEQTLNHVQRNKANVAVMLVNLDRFRAINDSLGHAIGDQVLVGMAQRFSLHIRHGDTLARLSGNEFCFLLNNLVVPDDALNLATRLQPVLAEPVEHAGHGLVVSASIGISVAPRDGVSADELLKAADTALLRAKLDGGSRFSFFSPALDANAQRRQQIEAQLTEALARGEFRLLYQPQVDLDSGSLTGVEVLLRWTNAELGSVSPTEFIPVAEASGLIVPIGTWVLRKACQQNRDWQDLGLAPLRVAVNVSTRQFRGEALVEEVRSVLADTRLAPEYLELEITESALIHDLDSAIATSRQLKALGVKLSLDDFGTGYSSLAYVARFPFDKLKIDQGFVRDITRNPANAAIATAAIAIARGLNLAVLAEGVETEAQALFLRSRRCDAMQGYLFSRPVAADEIARLLAERARLQLSEARGKSEQTLLVVDDESSILSAISRLLRHDPFQVLTVGSCTEAFDLLARHPVQVIVSDQRMAGMTGTEFFTRVRQLYPDTVRIILSGYTELASVMDAINHGAVYKFLTKPWDDEELREQIREAFRIVASRDQS